MTMTDINLTCLTISLAVLVLGGAGLSLRRLHQSVARPLLILGTGMVLWLVLVAVINRTGMTAATDFSALPPRALSILVPSLFLTLLLAFSSIGRSMAQGLTWTELVGFQVFRLPVELILYGFFFENRIPQSMTFAGHNFDVLTAIAAVVLAVLIWRGLAGRKAVWVWNIAGSVLLLNILVIAVRTLPGFKMGELELSLPNTLPFQWPSVWIIFCVLLALLGHLITFRKLLSRDGNKNHVAEAAVAP